MGKKANSKLTTGTLGERQQNLEQGKLQTEEEHKTSKDMPHYREATLDPRKFVEYSLNPQSKTGGAGKSEVYKTALGYDKTNYESLMQQIANAIHGGTAILIDTIHNERGTTYRFELPVTGPNGKTKIVRANFFIGNSETIPRLATNYVK